jgi:hypothetical protein
MSNHIVEEGPHRGHAAGDSDLEKQASQLASDVRYKVRKSMGSGSKMSPAQVSRAYLAQLAKSPAPGAVKSMAKKKLMGEAYGSDIENVVEESISKKVSKIFSENYVKPEPIQQEIVDESLGDEKKYMIVVKDKETGNTYRRKATRAKIAELRANPNIASVEMTHYGKVTDDEAKSGKKTAAAKAGKDYDGDRKVESGSKEHAGAVHNAIQRKKGGVADGQDTRKEEYVDEAITSEKGKAKAAEMIAKRSTPSGRAKSGQGANVAQIKHIRRANVDGYGGTPPNLKVAKNPVKSNFTGLNTGTGNKAARRAAALKKEEYVDEGLRSAVKRLLGGKKKEEPAKPMSRGEQLRKKYNVGPERSDTSAKRQILDRTRVRAERDQKQYGGSVYTKRVADKSKAAHDRYMKSGYSKYGVDDRRGSGNKARKRAAALNREEFDWLVDTLIGEGYDLSSYTVEQFYDFCEEVIYEKENDSDRKITGKGVNNYKGKNTVVNMSPSIGEQTASAEAKKTETGPTPEEKKQIEMKKRMLQKKLMLQKQAMQMQKQGRLPLNYSEEHDQVRYCPKCDKDETREECKYGGEYWDENSKPAKAEDPRGMKAKSNMVRNKLRAMGLKMSHDIEGEMVESAEDRLRDMRQERGGVDGNVDYRRAPKSNTKKFGSGKTMAQKEMEKKYGKGASAMDIVKAQIHAKHGKGSTK